MNANIYIKITIYVGHYIKTVVTQSMLNTIVTVTSVTVKKLLINNTNCFYYYLLPLLCKVSQRANVEVFKKGDKHNKKLLLTVAEITNAYHILRMLPMYKKNRN